MQVVHLPQTPGDRDEARASAGDDDQEYDVAALIVTLDVSARRARIERAHDRPGSGQ